MPIRVVARVRAKPGLQGTVEVALRGLLAPTRAEAGCVFYELYRSIEDPCAFCFVEEWKDRAALDAHSKSAHLQAALAQAGPFIAGAPEIREYTA